MIPLYQEEAGIPDLAAGLEPFLEREAERRPVEVVLVDDGSTDASWSLLRHHFADRHDCVLLRHPHNLGLGAALETGSVAARGDYIAWFDSDLTYQPELLGQFATELDRGKDVALSSCYHPDGGIDGVAKWRLALSRAASRLYRSAVRWRHTAGPPTPLHTYTSMVRAYRREVLARSRARRGGFLAVTEVLLRALCSGAQCVEVPAVLARRRTGQSKMRILRVAIGHLGLVTAFLSGRLDQPLAEGLPLRESLDPQGAPFETLLGDRENTPNG